MKISTVVFMLLVIPLSLGRKRGLALHPEEVVTKAEDYDEKDRVVVDKAVDSKENVPVIEDKAVDDNVKLRAITDKLVADYNAKTIRVITGKPDYSEKTRVIFPTEAGETVRGITKDVTKEKIKIPERLLIAMNNVQSADEFLRRFVARDPDDETSNTTTFEFSESSKSGIINRKGLSGAKNLQVTPFAACEPQKTVVKVKNPEGEGLLLWPPCVQLRRCGGCCTSELMTCRPIATSTVNVTVLQARYTGPQSSPFANEGVRIVTMEQHDRCRCGCKELPEDCTELQEYRMNECRCVCANQNEAIRCQDHANKFWDGRDCVCKCRNTRQCSSGLFFNIKTCRCEVLRLSLTSRIINLFYEDRNGTEDTENENKNLPNDRHD